MTKLLKRLKSSNYPRTYLTSVELDNLLGGTPDSRYSKVKRMLAQGKLLHIRKGLYCISDEMGYFKTPHTFELAQYIYGPSYISLESALSYHQLIPEAVYTTTSATGKRSKTFDTPLGIFSYQHVPLDDLFLEVKLVIDKNGYKFFMAKPWKAICDYVFCYKKDWKNLDPLINSLRINPENLPTLNIEEILALDEYYHHVRISRFLKGIQKNLSKLISLK